MQDDGFQETPLFGTNRNILKQMHIRMERDDVNLQAKELPKDQRMKLAGIDVNAEQCFCSKATCVINLDTELSHNAQLLMAHCTQSGASDHKMQ